MQIPVTDFFGSMCAEDGADIGSVRLVIVVVEDEEEQGAGGRRFDGGGRGRGLASRPSGCLRGEGLLTHSRCVIVRAVYR